MLARSWQLLLLTYATSSTICNAASDRRSIRQQPCAEEVTYSGLIDDAEHRFGNVHDKIDKITLSVKDLLSSVQKITVRFRELSEHRPLPCEELAEYAQIDGRPHRERIGSLRVAKIVRTNSAEQPVHLTAPRKFNRRSVLDGEQLYDIENGSIQTDKLSSTIDTPNFQPLQYVGDRTMLPITNDGETDAAHSRKRKHCHIRA